MTTARDNRKKIRREFQKLLNLKELPPDVLALEQQVIMGLLDLDLLKKKFKEWENSDLRNSTVPSK